MKPSQLRASEVSSPQAGPFIVQWETTAFPVELSNRQPPGGAGRTPARELPVTNGELLTLSRAGAFRLHFSDNVPGKITETSCSSDSMH